jgi:hypothetical protein
MTKSITISYELHPPSGTVAPDLAATKTFQIVLRDSASQKSFYGSVSDAIVAAKETLGRELTVWRDAVGSREMSKETSKTMKYEEGGEEEEET